MSYLLSQKAIIRAASSPSRSGIHSNAVPSTPSYFGPYPIPFVRRSPLKDPRSGGDSSTVVMALDQTTKIALAVAILGTLSFIFGVVAENKKPPYGTPIKGKDVVICKFPNDPTIILGSLSAVTLFLAAVIGHVAVYFPYKGKTVPTHGLFRSTSLTVFFIIAEAVSVLGLVLMVWATVSEGLHRSRNVHHDLDTECPTAKTGLFGGAAFLALDAALFWLVCQMLTMNARADYLDEDDTKGEYGQVYASEFGADGHSAPKV